jgi:hypothetical protein
LASAAEANCFTPPAHTKANASALWCEIPGLLVLIRAKRLPQRTASAITLSELPRFAHESE